LTQVFHPRWWETYLQQIWMKECDLFFWRGGGQNTLTPPTYFRGSRPPQPWGSMSLSCGGDNDDCRRQRSLQTGQNDCCSVSRLTQIVVDRFLTKFSTSIAYGTGTTNQSDFEQGPNFERSMYTSSLILFDVWLLCLITHSRTGKCRDWPHPCGKFISSHYPASELL